MKMKRIIASGAVVGALALGIVGIAEASIPDASGVIYGCIAKAGLPVLSPPAGTIRIIDSATQSCNNNENPITWNQTGPKGPVGPPGVKGDKGDACPPTDAACVGPRGLQGAEGDPGLVWRGAWDASRLYHPDDLVTWQGSAYVAVADNDGGDPTDDTTDWKLLAAQGSPGRLGPVGPKGDKGDPCRPGDPACVGPKGDRGPSDAYIARSADVHLSGFQYTLVLTLNLPAGTYAVTSKVNLQNDDGDAETLRCLLSTGDQDFITLGGIGDAAYTGTAVVEDLLTLSSAGSVSVTCVADNAEAQDSKIIATQVGAIHG